MGSSNARDPQAETFWHDFLILGDPRERSIRRFFLLLPHEPRCRLCAAPFAGAGRPIARLLGKRQSRQNPNVCSACFDFLAQHRGGAEIDCTMLFADIRGSTAIAESMAPAAYHDLLQRFYAAVSAAIFDHDGIVDKFVGDEVVAMFAPMLTDTEHPAKAVAAARAVLRVTGHEDGGGPWVPVGVGVHTGPAWVGVVGEGIHVEMTALGDAVNVAARLASAAAAGEVLVSTVTADAARLEVRDRRLVDLKGKQEPVEVTSLRVGVSVGST